MFEKRTNSIVLHMHFSVASGHHWKFRFEFDSSQMHANKRFLMIDQRIKVLICQSQTLSTEIDPNPPKPGLPLGSDVF